MTVENRPKVKDYTNQTGVENEVQQELPLLSSVERTDPSQERAALSSNWFPLMRF